MEALAVVIVVMAIGFVYVVCELFELCKKIDKELEDVH